MKQSVDRQKRFGALVGMRMLGTLLRESDRSLTVMELAKRLDVEESYIRRICRAAVEEGLITVRTEEQYGTRPVQLFSWAG